MPSALTQPTYTPLTRELCQSLAARVRLGELLPGATALYGWWDWMDLGSLTNNDIQVLGHAIPASLLEANSVRPSNKDWDDLWWADQKLILAFLENYGA